MKQVVTLLRKPMYSDNEGVTPPKTKTKELVILKTRNVKTLEEVKATGANTIVFDGEGQFYTQPMWNPFCIRHGRSWYSLSAITFFTKEGEEHRTNSGWFGSNNAHSRMGFESKGKQVEVKKKKSIDFTSEVPFFISLGKDWSGDNKAELFIPMSYLEGMGYTIKEATSKGEFETFVKTELYTEHFSIYLKGENTKHLDTIKEAFLKEFNEAKDGTEIREVMKKWEYKF